MKKLDYMILVCNPYRVVGDAQGASNKQRACNKQGAKSLEQYLTEDCADRGINVVYWMCWRRIRP
jgi:hypothetical protein